jgi:hypothetical protein
MYYQLSITSETSRCQYIKHNQYLNVMICLAAMIWKYEDDICLLNAIRLLYVWREIQYGYEQ